MKKSRILPTFGTTTLILGLFAAVGLAQQPLLTKAEATAYKATSRQADVRAFIDGLVKLSPLVRVETIGRTAGGWDVPALIVADPPVTSPEQLRRDGRAVIYIQANIHAGEVEGKEACLMLARDIVTAEKIPYLEKFVLVIVPNLNADGNEKIDPRNRSYQPGPVEGVGIRTNDWNLDLNRDGMKLESPEISAVVRNVHLRWDPLILVDCHTTDGSFHQEVTTYAWGVNPNGDPGIRTYMADVMMPAVERLCEQKYETSVCGYGYFRDDKDPAKGWGSMEFEPRFGTNYFQLRNRFSILIENNVYADFKTRVRANYRLLRSIFDYASEHFDEIKALAARADARAVLRGLNPGPDDVFGLEFDYRPLKEPLTVHSYVTEVVPGPWPNRRATDKVEIHTIPYYADGFSKRSVPFPAGYLITSSEPGVLNLLLRHGIAVERLTEPAEVEVETFKIKDLKAAERLYQGHRTNKVSGEYAQGKIAFPAGTLVVSTAQPLGTLAAYLLEPESDDGLVVWNFFDKLLASSWGGGTAGMAVPVYSFLKPAALPVEIVR
ncbi:MAG: M14 family metallopeptidase [Candidatus Aminicenantales bacterium]